MIDIFYVLNNQNHVSSSHHKNISFEKRSYRFFGMYIKLPPTISHKLITILLDHTYIEVMINSLGIRTHFLFRVWRQVFDKQ